MSSQTSVRVCTQCCFFLCFVFRCPATFECSIESFPLFYAHPSKLYTLQERNKLSTHQGVAQVPLVFRIDSLPFRSLKNWLLQATTSISYIKMWSSRFSSLNTHFTSSNHSTMSRSHLQPQYLLITTYGHSFLHIPSHSHILTLLRTTHIHSLEFWWTEQKPHLYSDFPTAQVQESELYHLSLLHP